MNDAPRDPPRRPAVAALTLASMAAMLVPALVPETPPASPPSPSPHRPILGGAYRPFARAIVLPGECTGCARPDCKHHGARVRKLARRAARASQAVR